MTKSTSLILDAEQLYRAIVDSDPPHVQVVCADDDKTVELIRRGFSRLDEKSREKLLERLGYSPADVNALVESFWALAREETSNVVPLFPQRVLMENGTTQPSIPDEQSDTEPGSDFSDQSEAWPRRRAVGNSHRGWYVWLMLILSVSVPPLAFVGFSKLEVVVNTLLDDQIVIRDPSLAGDLPVVTDARSSSSDSTVAVAPPHDHIPLSSERSVSLTGDPPVATDTWSSSSDLTVAVALFGEGSVSLPSWLSVAGITGQPQTSDNGSPFRTALILANPSEWLQKEKLLVSGQFSVANTGTIQSAAGPVNLPGWLELSLKVGDGGNRKGGISWGVLDRRIRL